MPLHLLLGMFVSSTVLLAGAAIGRLLGLSAGEGLYATALTLGVGNWFVGRRARRREDCR